ncbi:MAG: GAF domain-containing protein [Phycisphaerales bacterium JB063]
MTHSLHNTAHDDPTLSRTLGEAVRAVGAAEGSVLLLDEQGKTLRFALSASPAADKLVGTEQPVTRGVVGLVVSFQQPTITNKLQDDPQHDPSVDAKVGITTTSQMAVPLSDSEREYGVLTAINSANDDGFTDADLQRYLDAARQITTRLGELAQITQGDG